MNDPSHFTMGLIYDVVVACEAHGYKLRGEPDALARLQVALLGALHPEAEQPVPPPLVEGTGRDALRMLALVVLAKGGRVTVPRDVAAHLSHTTELVRSVSLAGDVVLEVRTRKGAEAHDAP